MQGPYQTDDYRYICTFLILLHVMFYEYTPAFDFNVILCNFLMLKVIQLSLYKT